jgi:hypothetical protein
MNSNAIEEMADLAERRATALGIPVVVCGFTRSGQATVYDGELVENGELELREVGRVRVTPSPPPEPDDAEPAA